MDRARRGSRPHSFGYWGLRICNLESWPLLDQPNCPAGWRFVDPDSARPDTELGKEQVVWNDPAGSLSVSRFIDCPTPVYRLRFIDQMVLDLLVDDRLIIDRSGPGPFPDSTRQHILHDQLYPRIEAHHDKLVLHAGAYVSDGYSVLVAGASGRGKSSLVASFDQAGLPLLGDDAMIISFADGIARARPVYPSLRLLPDSIEALMPEIITAGPIAHYSRKERIDVAGNRQGASEPLPVRAIFAIAEPSPHAIQIRRLPPGKACIELLANSFALDPSDTSRARQRMEQASKLLRQAPAFELAYPRDYARLPEVRQAILDQVASLASA